MEKVIKIFVFNLILDFFRKRKPSDPAPRTPVYLFSVEECILGRVLDVIFKLNFDSKLIILLFYGNLLSCFKIRIRIFLEKFLLFIIKIFPRKISILLKNLL